MPSPKSQKSKSLSDLGDLIMDGLGWPSTHESAEWYLQPNPTIPWPNKPHFDPNHPENNHPVLLLDRQIRPTDPPTQTYPCWIRSSTVYSIIRHDKHSHPTKACSLNREGYIVAESSVPIAKEDLLRYFCDEPQNSKLLTQLRRHVDKISQQVGSM
jgi:hypothetical protein